MSAYGFRIVGPCTSERRLVDHARAFAAYCAADARAGVECESYLSAFTFGDAFRDHQCATGSTKGYAGPCGGSWLWFDIDRDDSAGGIDAALRDARTLAVQLGERFAVADDGLLAFYSGSKGFHMGLPLDGFTPEPGLLFHRVARRLAGDVAEAAGVAIDTGVYDRVRAFRAPNSRHPKTGRHKRRLSVDELLHLPAARIVELAGEPEPFDLPDATDTRCGPELPAAWHDATERVRQEAEAETERRKAIASGDATARLNRSTMDYLREGASVGDRHRLLFSASANLAECGATLHLCRELLVEAALDSGLPPADVERQIRCGYEHVVSGRPSGGGLDAGDVQVRDELHAVGRAAVGVRVDHDQRGLGQTGHLGMMNLKGLTAARIDPQRLEGSAAEHVPQSVGVHTPHSTPGVGP